MENKLLVNFRCENSIPTGKKCLTVVARTNGLDLYFDDDKVPGNPCYIGFNCKSCGGLVKWKRGKQTGKPR
jgi:hypothetical protein